jgi:hypothetical protein
MKKSKFYAYICPVCGEKTVGSWVKEMKEWYIEHFLDNHKPIIIKDDGDREDNRYK